MRLFLIINVPTELHPYLLEMGEKYEGLKQTKDFHLTLQFLGDRITEQQKYVLVKTLKKIRFEPFTITLSKVNSFGSPEETKGMWVKCLPSGELQKLASNIREIIKPLGFEPDQPFKPHITLGRYKNIPKKDPPSFSADSRSFLVDRFYLVRSHLNPDGSEYVVLDEFKGKNS